MELDSIYEGLYEYYVNDYIVFENILKRDYLEITGVLTEADNRNFLQKFWDKIIQLIETMKQKISILIDKVTIKMDENKIKSLTKKLNKNKDLIEKTCLAFFPIDEFNQPDTTPIDDLKREVKLDTKNSISQMMSVAGEAEIRRYKSKISESKNRFSAIHDKMWKDVKENGKKSGEEGVNRYKSELTIKALTDGVEKYLKSIIEAKKLKEQLVKHYNSLKKEAKQKQREYKKDKKDEQLKIAKDAYTYISLTCQYDFQVIKFVIKEERNIFKNHLNLIKRVISYSKSKSDKENKENFDKAKTTDEFFDKNKKTTEYYSDLGNTFDKDMIDDINDILNDFNVGHDFDNVDFDNIDPELKKQIQDELKF